MRRLTELSHGAGCGCKLAPGMLAEVMGRLAPTGHPDLLVGLATGDDAAVWRIGPSRALVATADFLTPIVDDARTWGEIAAVNAASDVYAMGGRPLLALNLVAWSSAELGPDLLVEVLDGARAAADAGGWVTAGGHSIEDPEPKFGLAVVGEVDPDRVLTNAGLRPGDHLVLTKALGTGLVATAVKTGRAPQSSLEAAVASMTTLNDTAARAATEAGATGMTDVTGFGLLGHLMKMARASGVDVDIDAAAVPVLPGAVALAQGGSVPGGTRRNLEWVAASIDAPHTSELTMLLLSDPQTSGGLLFGAGEEEACAAVAALNSHGLPAEVIGRARPGTGRISIQGDATDGPR